MEFIKKVLQDEEWLKAWVENILNGKTGLKDEGGNDIFQERFRYLKNRGIDYEDLYRRIFGGKGGLSLYELKNAEGEIGLKIGENEYFGVINIGNVSGFKKQLEKKGIGVKEDAISNSLFDDIKKKDSKINLLIGSKKFIEGWDTWRVASMGLLNIGKGQGPQIIQLFGRGVRLKGKGMSLKRSGENRLVKILEMLNIYGIKADYLNKFLEAISREEVEFEAIEIPIKFQHKDKWKTLYTLDLLPKVSIYEAKERRGEGIETRETKPENTGWRFNTEENLANLLDLDRIYQEALEFKIQRNYWNLVFDKDTLKNILLSDSYRVKSPPETLGVKNEEDIKRLENIALLVVIKKYLDLFYRKNAKRFETENLRYESFQQLPLPFISENKQGYTVQIDKRKKELIKEIRDLTRDLNRLLKEDASTLPRIYFDNCLYVPILLQSEDVDKISPAGLVKSEKDFVMGLRDYIKKNRDKFSNTEIYLLRNIPKSGVGFQLQWAGFYPDFIMYYVDKRKEKTDHCFYRSKRFRAHKRIR